MTDTGTVPGAMALLAVSSMVQDPQNVPGVESRRVLSSARVMRDEIIVNNNLVPAQYIFSEVPENPNAAIISGTSLCSDEVADIVASSFATVTVEFSESVEPVVASMTDERPTCPAAFHMRAYLASTSFLLTRVESIANAYFVVMRAMANANAVGVPLAMVIDENEADSRLASRGAVQALASVEGVGLTKFVSAVFELTLTQSEAAFHRSMARIFNDQLCRITQYRNEAIFALYQGHAPPADVMRRRNLAAALTRANSGRVVPNMLKHIVKDITLLNRLGLLDQCDLRVNEEVFADDALALYTILEAFPVGACCGARYVDVAADHLKGKESSGRSVFEAYCDAFAEVVVRFSQHFDALQQPAPVAPAAPPAVPITARTASPPRVESPHVSPARDRPTSPVLASRPIEILPQQQATRQDFARTATSPKRIHPTERPAAPIQSAAPPPQRESTLSPPRDHRQESANYSQHQPVGNQSVRPPSPYDRSAGTATPMDQIVYRQDSHLNQSAAAPAGHGQQPQQVALPQNPGSKNYAFVGTAVSRPPPSATSPTHPVYEAASVKPNAVDFYANVKARDMASPEKRVAAADESAVKEQSTILQQHLSRGEPARLPQPRPQSPLEKYATKMGPQSDPYDVRVLPQHHVQPQQTSNNMVVGRVAARSPVDPNLQLGISAKLLQRVMRGFKARREAAFVRSIDVASTRRFRALGFGDSAFPQVASQPPRPASYAAANIGVNLVGVGASVASPPRDTKPLAAVPPAVGRVDPTASQIYAPRPSAIRVRLPPPQERSQINATANQPLPPPLRPAGKGLSFDEGFRQAELDLQLERELRLKRSAGGQ